MPPKSRMSQSDGDYYNVMPAMYEKDNLAMLKMIGRHSIKRGEHRSTMMGDILLYEADTGILKALMDAEYITTLRTGVVAAHSAMLFVHGGDNRPYWFRQYHDGLLHDFAEQAA